MGPLSKFRKLEKISEGGMGVVYRAWDPTLSRPVAIKFVRLSGESSSRERAEFEARLRREAQAAGNLSHPNIVTIYNLIQQGDSAYIEMEYVDGQSLQAWMGECDVLGPHVVLDIIRQSATALDYAHSKGVVHRDIKPSNILLGNDGVVKLVDFGLAKLATASKLTQTGSAVGTPHYMSAEQIDGDRVEPQSDQYSLAVCAYEMITGAKPFTGESLQALFNRILNSLPVAASQVNHSLGREIDVVLARALAKKAEERYGTCLEFAASLERACALRPAWRPKTSAAPVKARAAAVGGVAVETPMPEPAEMQRPVPTHDPWLTEALSLRATPRPSAASPVPTPPPTPALALSPPEVPPSDPIAITVPAPVSPPAGKQRYGLLAALVALIAVLAYALFVVLGSHKAPPQPQPQAIEPPGASVPAASDSPVKKVEAPSKPKTNRPPAARKESVGVEQPGAAPAVGSDVPADVGSRPVKLAIPKKK
jgi:serine/threonine protein kinase